jgi:hypothetical protein
MPDNTGFYIDDIAIPVSWYAVAANRNNVFYFKINGTVYMETIIPGDYSLITFNEALVGLMNSKLNAFTSHPTVSDNSVGIRVTSLVTNFEILTDAQVKGLNGDASATVNNILRNFTPKINDNANPYKSGYVDLFPIRNLYLSCSGMGNFNTMSVNGDRSIIKKIPVTAGYGEMIFDQSVVGIDYLDCSHQTLSRISFQLKDVFGRLIDLHGNHFSFSIVFSRIQEIQ